MTLQIRDQQKALVAKLTAGKTGKMKSYIAILLVSVGKENFEEEALRSALKMINQEFKACCIVLADTLQRYNLSIKNTVNEEQAYFQSLAEGDRWLARYEADFKKIFKIPYEIIRWDHLITDLDYKDKEAFFSFSIENNQNLALAMNKSIEEYGKRLQKRLTEDDFKAIFSHHLKNCFSYLREECVALRLVPKTVQLIPKDRSPLVIVYPGKSTAILRENREFFIKDEFQQHIQQDEDFLNWIPYRFNSYPSKLAF